MDSREGKPIEPEIVQGQEDGLQGSGGLHRLEYRALDRPPLTIRSLFEILLRSPKSEERQSRAWTGAVRAQIELIAAVGDLAIAQEKLRDLKTIIKTDKTLRQLDLLRAQNAKDEEERIGRLKKLSDLLAEERMRAEIAEARRRREQAENPAPQKPADEESLRREAIRKEFREKMGRRFTEHEVRTHAAQLIEEIKQRGHGTADREREIENVLDVMEHILNEP